MTTYDSEEEPKTADECRQRLIEAIIWEFLDEDHGLFMDNPFSNFNEWKESAQKRYVKAAIKLKKELETGKKAEVSVSNSGEKKTHTQNLFRNPTLRDYMRLHVGN